jgi:CheY-like chemotaxis protein/two-component sensor histidine kinase
VERLGHSANSDLVLNIDSALESVETILGAVLDLSRLDTGAMKPAISSVPLNELLRRIETDYQPLARAKNLELKVLPATLSVKSDPMLLRRLVQNLVSNAIKYTITGKVLVGVRRRGKEAWIQVSDTGIGIPTSKYRTVFKEFARLDEGVRTASGLGLGLSIVDRISRVLSHPVDINSVPGKGTTFRVRLPVDAAVAKPVKSRDPIIPHRVVQKLDGLNVFCVDNEESILDGMRVLLSGWGCTVVTASSLAECIKAVHAGRKPDVIMADYHLDDGTGLDAIHAFRTAHGELPAVLITADRTPEVRSAAEESTITLLNKPVKPAALRAVLTRIAGLARVAAE